MLIAQVPARSFGPAASIGGIVTAGFSSGAAPLPPSYIFLTPHFIEYVARIN